MKATTPTLASAAFLAFVLFFCANNASARVIYKDIDPDITRASTGNTKIDVDEDGNNDFEIDLNILGLKDVWLTLNTLGENKVAMQDWHSRLFDQDNLINDTCGWQSDAGLPLAYLTSGVPEGPWPGKKYSYLGFQFVLDGAKHYGWLRIEVAENVRSFAIRELAYEDIPDLAILAGDKTKTISVKDFNRENTSPAFTISNRVLQINSNDISNPCNVYISDLSGKVLLRSAITSGNNVIDLNRLASGIYCVSFYNRNSILTRKISLQ